VSPTAPVRPALVAPMGDAGPIADPGTEYGEVFTRRWVVDLVLDLVGYTPEDDLASRVLVEPSCGTGAFLLPAVQRLIVSGQQHGRDLRSLGSALCAFDLLEANVERARKAVSRIVQEAGLKPHQADGLAEQWITTGDFLLEEHALPLADFVVGNPPYIRLESVPRPVMEAYRRLCATMRGRSDIYIGFLERGLKLLKPDGALGYICADRWMRNQYGAELREFISGAFSVDAVISMHDVDAFEDEVSAYPAVVVVRNREQAGAAVVEARAGFGESDAQEVAAWVRQPRNEEFSAPTFEATRLDRWFQGRDLWPSASPGALAVLADLEARFAPLEDPRTATRVGIGVATGCDDVYITTDADMVEEERLLPLLRAADTTDGVARWSGSFLVNPWDDNGLVDLRRYPRLRAYYEAHAGRLRTRYVARRRPAQWYRTIDRVAPKLQNLPKLVIPDLKSAAHPVLDDGRYYPHHNLYYVVSDSWDPEVLGGLLLSDIANLFVGAYCVKMRGGCYRFQAQYLRRIRVPELSSVSTRHRRALARAFTSRDVEAATATAKVLYGLDEVPRLG
jgi:adenine-specific DNA-methyltransferase